MHLALIAAVSLLASPSPFSQEGGNSAPRAAIEHYNLASGRLAIEGYDPVSYFSEGGGRPKKGSNDFALNYRGVSYRFTSEAHRDQFLTTPERYEPAYGGWCAYAMALKGEKVEVDPESYLFENGQLLLFYKGFLNNTRKSWSKKGGQKLGPQADQRWQAVSGEAPHRPLWPFNLTEGIALEGYDPVSYRSGAPAKGKLAFTQVHNGVTYHFASDANRATFLADPAPYEAKYGGWCAWAMARGKQVKVDPTAFALDGSELYLFYNKSKRDDWNADRALKPKADAEWNKLGAN